QDFDRWPVSVRRKGIDNLPIDQRRMNTDAFDEVPGKAALQQELRLLPFLASPPIPRLYSGPIDLAEVRQVAAILKEIRAGIRQSERPTLILLMRPRNRCLEVGLEVEDWTLAAA